MSAHVSTCSHFVYRNKLSLQAKFEVKKFCIRACLRGNQDTSRSQVPGSQMFVLFWCTAFPLDQQLSDRLRLCRPPPTQDDRLQCTTNISKLICTSRGQRSSTGAGEGGELGKTRYPSECAPKGFDRVRLENVESAHLRQIDLQPRIHWDFLRCFSTCVQYS